jgi:hypothetical protein
MTYSNGTTTNGQAIDVEKLAISANSPQKIADLLQEIASYGNGWDKDPQARFKLLEASRSLTYALETPREAILRHCWSEVCFLEVRGEKTHVDNHFN